MGASGQGPFSQTPRAQPRPRATVTRTVIVFIGRVRRRYPPLCKMSLPPCASPVSLIRLWGWWNPPTSPLSMAVHTQAPTLSPEHGPVLTPIPAPRFPAGVSSPAQINSDILYKFECFLRGRRHGPALRPTQGPGGWGSSAGAAEATGSAICAPGVVTWTGRSTWREMPGASFIPQPGGRGGPTLSIHPRPRPHPEKRWPGAGRLGSFQR